MNLNAEKIEIKQTKVKLTISLSIDKYESADEKVQDLIDMAIRNGCSANIRKQVLTENGVIKIGDRHTFY